MPVSRYAPPERMSPFCFSGALGPFEAILRRFNSGPKTLEAFRTIARECRDYFRCPYSELQDIELDRIPFEIKAVWMVMDMEEANRNIPTPEGLLRSMERARLVDYFYSNPLPPVRTVPPPERPVPEPPPKADPVQPVLVQEDVDPWENI